MVRKTIEVHEIDWEWIKVNRKSKTMKDVVQILIKHFIKNGGEIK